MHTTLRQYTYEWKKHKIKNLTKLHCLHVIKYRTWRLRCSFWKFLATYLSRRMPAKSELFFLSFQRGWVFAGFLINRDSHIFSYFAGKFYWSSAETNKQATCSLINTSDQLLGSLGNLVISSRFGSILLVLGNLFLKLHVTFNVIIFMPTTLPTICA